MLPLVTLEDQLEGEMAWLGLPYVNVTSTPLKALEEQIQNIQPYVLLGNVESLNSADVQRKISKLKISYIAIDEAQVSFSFSLAQIQIQRQRQSGIFYGIILLEGGRPCGRLDRVQALLSRSLALATRNLPWRPVYAELCNFEHNQP